MSPDQPDPSLYIQQLSNEDAFHREAAAWTLGEIGNPRAGRPLAGLLLREIRTVERTGYLENSAVVRAAAEAIRRLGAIEALYALVKTLCALSGAQGVDPDTVAEIVEAIGEVGGPNAVCEAANRVAREVRDGRRGPSALSTVAWVLLPRLGLCGDAAVKTLRRLARGGPGGLQPIAAHVFDSV